MWVEINVKKIRRNPTDAVCTGDWCSGVLSYIILLLKSSVAKPNLIKISFVNKIILWYNS